MKYFSAPIEVGIDVTNQCNLKCMHCYASSTAAKSANELTLKEMQDLVDQLVKMKVFRLFLGGGEPFMRRDTIDLIAYAKKKGMCVVASSNGYFLTEEKLKLLKSLEMDNIQISIDGGKEETHDICRGVKGSFKKAVGAAKLMSKVGIPLTIGTTISKYNAEEIADIINICLDVKASVLHIMGLQPGGRGTNGFWKKSISDDTWIKISKSIEQESIRLKGKLSIILQGNRFALINNMSKEEISKRNEDFDDVDKLTLNCVCAKARCTIDGTGNVIPCDMMRVSDMNVRNHKFEYIWHNSKVLNDIRNRDVSDIDDCRGCPIADICRGGCAATTYNIYNTLKAADPRCKLASHSYDRTPKIQDVEKL